MFEFQKRRRKTVEVRTSEKNKRVFRKHPLSVVNTVSCKGNIIDEVFLFVIVIFHLIFLQLNV